MDLCFFSGIIESEPDFKFIISKKLNFKDSLHISISKFYLKIDENTKVLVKAYDELADYCYKNFNRGDFISVYGKINDLIEIEIDFCQKLW